MEEEQRSKDEERSRQAAEAARSRQVAHAQEREEATKDLIASLPEGTSVAFQLDPAILTSVVKGVAVINEDEATFEATSDGLFFRQMDVSHVSLLEVTIPSQACNTYTYQSKTPSVHFTVRTKEFLQLLKLVDVSSQLTFVLEGDSLTCTAGPDRVHKIHLYETSYQAAPLPKIELEAKAVLEKSRLQKILRECTVAGEEQVTITAEGTQISFNAKSDFGVSEVKLHKFDAEVLDLIVSGRQRATYTVAYLFGILKAISVADVATIEWSSKKPVRMTLPLADIQYGANAVFWLAPRVGDSDEPKPAAEPDEGPQSAPEPSQQPNESPPTEQAQPPVPEPQQPAPAPEKPKRGSKRKPKGEG